MAKELKNVGASVRARLLHKAEYEHQRRHMMQEWANIVDAWIAGQKYAPTIFPPTMDLLSPGTDD